MNGTIRRKYWIDALIRVADPVLTALAERRLKRDMPIESKMDRSDCTHLEVLGRTLCGIAPWLELQGLQGEEEQLRSKYAELARQAIDAATDPNSPDYSFSENPVSQHLVDAAFLAHAIVRAPHALWQPLHERVKENVVRELKKTRRVRAAFCNWLLFSAMVETALHVIGEQFDIMRIDYALNQHEQWYKGDGMYGDGPYFHWDYYNSYVIQPMLVDTILTVGHLYPNYEKMKEPIIRRAQRYAVIQEKLISPDGTFPAIGRSIAYRCGAFQLLAQIALMKQLPNSLRPAQVRCGLQAVIRRCLDVPGTFDENGWLQIGLAGHQPSLGENYISTGSLYLCTTAFLPLGLPPEDEFWSGEDERWSAQKIWSGMDMPADHAMREI